MRLNVTILPFLFLAAFGYLAHTVNDTSDDGVINKDAAIQEIKEDFNDVDEFFQSGAPAQDQTYND